MVCRTNVFLSSIVVTISFKGKMRAKRASEFGDIKILNEVFAITR